MSAFLFQNTRAPPLHPIATVRVPHPKTLMLQEAMAPALALVILTGNRDYNYEVKRLEIQTLIPYPKTHQLQAVDNRQDLLLAGHVPMVNPSRSQRTDLTVYVMRLSSAAFQVE